MAPIIILWCVLLLQIYPQLSLCNSTILPHHHKDPFLDQLIPGTFRVVSSDVVWSSRSTDKQSRKLSSSTPPTLSITLDVPGWSKSNNKDGMEVEFKIKPAHALFHKDFEHHVVGSDGKMMHVQDGIVETAKSCLFEGHIAGEAASSSAVVSFCGGQLQAVLHRKGHESMLVKPLPSDPVHSVVFARRALDGDAAGGTCGVNTTAAPPSSASSASSTADRNGKKFEDVPNFDVSDREFPPLNERRNKVLELLIINSASRHKQWGQRTPLHSAYITALVQNIYDNLELDYRIWFVITGMVTFQGRDPFEGDGPDIVSDGTDANMLLDAVDNWRGRFEKDLPRHDLAEFLSGSQFSLNGETNVVGLTRLDSVCTQYRTGIIQATTPDADMIASITAHEIGHGLGMRHTNKKPTGLEAISCTGVMDTSVFRQTDWSRCSSEWTSRFFDGSEEMDLPRKYGTEGWPLCLDKAPDLNAAWAPGRAVCGNGIVEEGETCDCPKNDCVGVNECCDGLACQLLPSPQCATQGPTSQGMISEMCSNGILDEDETDIDCGEACKLPCVVGQRCTSELDCAFPSSCVADKCVDDFVLPKIFQSPYFNRLANWIDENMILFVVIVVFGSLSVLSCIAAFIPMGGRLGEGHDKRARSMRIRVRQSARVIRQQPTRFSRARTGSFLEPPSNRIVKASYGGAHIKGSKSSFQDLQISSKNSTMFDEVEVPKSYVKGSSKKDIPSDLIECL